MIREQIGVLIPHVAMSKLRHWNGTRTFRLWIVWFRAELTIEVCR